MKILMILEFAPGSTIHSRSRLTSNLTESGFVRLRGVSGAWVADECFDSVEEAKDALAEAAASSRVAIHKAYLVEYNRYEVFSTWVR